jgi:CBS domain-containing protein
VAIVGEGLTYDDVLLVPRYCGRSLPRDADTRTQFCRASRDQDPSRVRRDGHRDRVAARDRARAAGRDRRHPQEPLRRAAGPRGREGQALRQRRDHRPGHPRARRHRGHRPRADARAQRLGLPGHRDGSTSTATRAAKVLGILTSRDLRSSTSPRRRRRGDDQATTSSPRRPARRSTRREHILNRNKVEKLLLSTGAARLAGLITMRDIEHARSSRNACTDERGAAALRGRGRPAPASTASRR